MTINQEQITALLDSVLQVAVSDRDSIEAKLEAQAKADELLLAWEPTPEEAAIHEALVDLSIRSTARLNSDLQLLDDAEAVIEDVREFLATPPPDPDPPPPPPPPLVLDVVLSTGGDFMINFFKVGELVYTDRDYVYSEIDAELADEMAISLPNDDKEVDDPEYLSFELGHDATVYVAFDPRASSLPIWLGGWTPTGLVVRLDDPRGPELHLYAKEFPAGKVVLGGNSLTGSESNYVVIVR